MKAAIIFILSLFFLASCAPAALPLGTLTPASLKIPAITLTPRPSLTLPPATLTPKPTVTVTPPPTPTANAAGLIILEREIKQMDTENMRIVMADGQKFGATELAEGAFLSEVPFQNQRGQLSTGIMDVTGRSLTTEYKGSLLTARQNFNHDYSQGWVTVDRDGRVIYQIYTGPASPIVSLRGLHSYAECAACAKHWVLETALIARTMRGSGIDDQGIGQLVEDGTLINKKYGYQAAFNFQTLGGKPFYFFQRIASLKSSDKIDAWYNGLIVPLGYDEIPHYGCASTTLLNPRLWADRLVFFARRGQTWYLVQISAIN